MESETNPDRVRQFGNLFYINIPKGINYKYLTEILADSNSNNTSQNLSKQNSPVEIIQRGCLNIMIGILN